MLLSIQNCSLSFGGLRALSHFNASLEQGELLGIIGPNGAGKTTLFNILTGVYPPDEGEILFNQKTVRGLAPFEMNRLGLARTFQNIRLFQNLTVEENVLVAYHCHLQSSLAQSVLRSPFAVAEERLRQKQALDLLKLFGLLEKRLELAKNLSYGGQRRLEIVRALCTGPRLLLLDEPAAGMNSTEKQQLTQLIRDIRQSYKLSIILIEHDMDVVMTLCPRLIVLDYGEIIAEGTPDEIRKNPKVIEAYLGKSA